MTSLFYFCEVHIVCLLLLFWVISWSLKSNDMQTGNVIFFSSAITAAAILLLDVCSALITGLPEQRVYILLNIFYAFRYALSGVFVFLWLDYTLFETEHRKMTVLGRIICYIPALFIIAGSLSSPWTHLFFSIQKNYPARIHGNLYIVHRIIIYLYYITSALIAATSLSKTQNSTQRTKQITLVSFILLPLVAGIIDVVFPATENAVIAATISLLFVFTDLQITQISIDGLTKLNNRRQFNDYLDTKLKPGHDGKRLYLFMMDVDLFKRINDEFGHPEGDNALVTAADTLRSVFSTRNAFLARFGGDEFVAVCLCRNDDDADAVRKTIYDAFETRNHAPNARYPLMMSIGYAPFTGEGKAAVLQMMKDADNALYKEKEIHHARRTD